jgi:KDO2-lipid IV(A) lauroyltransferase
MTKKQTLKRFKVLNPEVLNTYYEHNKPILALASHYTNWEWGILAVDFQIKHQAVSIYKPLNNKDMESFSLRRRTRFGMQLVGIEETKAFFAKPKEKPTCTILAADQNPSDSNNAILVDFFNVKNSSFAWARSLWQNNRNANSLL